QAVTGWQYIDGLKYYFSDTGVLVQDLDSVIGIQPSYHLKVNKTLNCMTAYAQDGANGYIIPVKSMLTSVGDDTPVGTFRTPEKYRWRLMVNDSYTQYATRLIAGQGFLFHSITYEQPNAETLFTGSYNLLGINRSLGCIRLTCENAKWVYDNCPIGTTVTVYEDAGTPGPYHQPWVKWIPTSQRWDPTDPAFAGR
ncbi:MAG: L,D-transpeptidase family protein, partial [Lachnospiraceae bacterium]